MATYDIVLTVNGREVAGKVAAETTLLDFLRDRNFIDVSVRGTFNLLDAAKESGAKQFILAGGDAALGIFFYENPEPLGSDAPLRAYPGYYAFSKVLEEVMVRQYGIQYGLPYTIMRYSWIQDADDLLCYMTFRPPEFGGPGWKGLATTDEQRAFFDEGRDGVGCLRHPGGAPYVRHVVAIGDVTGSMTAALDNPAALGEAFNVATPEPFRYDELAAYIARKLDIPAVDFEWDGAHDFSIDVSKTRDVLGYAPQWTTERIVDDAIAFRALGGARPEVRYGG